MNVFYCKYIFNDVQLGCWGKIKILKIYMLVDMLPFLKQKKFARFVA